MRTFEIVLGCLFTVFASSAYASMTGMNIISQTYHIWGGTYCSEISLNDSYDITNSVPVIAERRHNEVVTDGYGTTSFTYYSGSSATEGILDAEGIAMIEGSRGNNHYSSWGIAPANAQVDYVFSPVTSSLELFFTGITGYHCWESWCTFELKDLNTLEIVDSRKWAWEINWGWDYVEDRDDLPYTGMYPMNPDHLYSMTLVAHATPGDQRRGYVHLEMTTIPEPATLILLGLGGMILRKKWQFRE
jgi:hypothetical protein